MNTVNKNTIWMPALFENLFLEDRPFNYEGRKTFSAPAVNILENLSNFVLEFAVPGFDKKDFSIEVEENILKVWSNRDQVGKDGQENGEKQEKEINDSQYRRREFGIRDFKRSFELPEDIESENIEANYENGILKITLPKMEKKKALKKMVEIS